MEMLLIQGFRFIVKMSTLLDSSGRYWFLLISDWLYWRTENESFELWNSMLAYKILSVML